MRDNTRLKIGYALSGLAVCLLDFQSESIAAAGKRSAAAVPCEARKRTRLKTFSTCRGISLCLECCKDLSDKTKPTTKLVEIDLQSGVPKNSRISDEETNHHTIFLFYKLLYTFSKLWHTIAFQKSWSMEYVSEEAEYAQGDKRYVQELYLRQGVWIWELEAAGRGLHGDRLPVISIKARESAQEGCRGWLEWCFKQVKGGFNVKVNLTYQLAVLRSLLGLKAAFLCLYALEKLNSRIEVVYG